jgi:hypothetical protein
MGKWGRVLNIASRQGYGAPGKRSAFTRRFLLRTRLRRDKTARQVKRSIGREEMAVGFKHLTRDLEKAENSGATCLH